MLYPIQAQGGTPRVELFRGIECNRAGPRRSNVALTNSIAPGLTNIPVPT